MARAVLLTGLLLLVGLRADAADIDPSLLAGMSARSIGPAGMSGRIAAIDAVASNPNIIYVGASTGGVWKSIDGGLTWAAVFDDQPVHAIGAIAINQDHPDIVWVGTGEANLRNSVSVGNGIYKTLDGGRTWSHLGLPESERVNRIVLHPQDPLVAYAAVTGKLWGDNEERGVYKTTDGGRSWRRVLYIDPRTGAADLVMDPTQPDKLVAAMYSFRRTPEFFESGGWGSGLYLTLDGGASWRQITEEDGLPSGKLGRIGLAIAPSDPRIVYAFVEAEKNGFYRSTDGGFTWKNTGAERRYGDRPFYYADIRVDPEYPDRVYSLWSLVTVSDDGGRTFRVLISWDKLHPDHHAMWINPRDGRHVIEGNDGGVGISYDRGETWRFVGNLPVAQYYHVRLDTDVPYHVYGGLQDNGSWRGPSTVWENGGIRNHHWQELDFGDGFDAAPYPKDSMQGYAMSQEGYVVRWNLRTGERRAIRPAPEPGDTLRFNWNAGFAQDLFDDDTIYFGSQYLHKSTDRGDTWTRLSPDLTSDNPAWQRQRESGGLTPDVTGAENFTTIVAVAPSPRDRDVLWVGTDDGRVQVTRDGGGTWTSVEKGATGVPRNAWVPHIEASPHDAGTAFVVFDDHRRSNLSPYVFRVTDYGKRWTSLATRDLSGYCLAVAQDPVDPDLLFLGTETGLYVSVDGGGRWMRWTHGIPTCSVMDLAIHPRESDLVIATHGRSLYVLDDIRPLRTLSAATMAEPLHLFEIPPAQQYRVRDTDGSRFPGATEFRGEVRPYGALITLSLADPELPHPDAKIERERKIAERAKQREPGAEDAEPAAGEKDAADGKRDGKAAAAKIHVEIHNMTGDKVRGFDRPVTRGVNRVVWDLRSDPFKSPASERSESEGRERSGPEVLPGRYVVTLKYKDAQTRGVIDVRPDPRAEIPLADRQAAWDTYQRAGHARETAVEAIQLITDARADIDFVLDKLRRMERERKADAGDEDEGDRGAGPDSAGASAGGPPEEAALRKEAETVKKGLAGLEKRLRTPADTKGYTGDITILDELSVAQEFLYSTWDRPSPTVMEYLERAERLLEDFLPDCNRFFAEDVAALRESVRVSGLSLFPAKDPIHLGR